MHLRAVKVRGFKSFPDPVEVRLEPGVGVIVGPNGSGKSNVADAIRWAAGSLSPNELRAEKDVAARMLGLNNHQSLIAVLNGRHKDLTGVRTAVRVRRKTLIAKGKARAAKSH